MATTGEHQRRARTAKARLAAEGGYPGGPLPYGLRLDAWGRWERDPDEVEILKQTARYRSRGTPVIHIANRLNILKIPAPKGGTWVHSTVLRLLMNPLYHRRIEDIPPELTGPRSHPSRAQLPRNGHPGRGAGHRARRAGRRARAMRLERQARQEGPTFTDWADAAIPTRRT
jgi:Recombinase